MLPKPVMDALTAHLETYPPTLGGYVFTDPEGGPVRVNAFRRRVWVPATVTAGLTGVRIHDVRHTAISLSIASGANLLEIKKRAGHEKSTFTVDRYGHLLENADSDDADRLAGLYVPVPTLGTVTPIRVEASPP